MLFLQNFVFLDLNNYSDLFYFLWSSPLGKFTHLVWDDTREIQDPQGLNLVQNMLLYVAQAWLLRNQDATKLDH